MTDPASLPHALKDVDTVVHCVGIILEPKGISFETVVQAGTANLVDACQTAHINQIIYISALGTRKNAVSRYHQTKWAAEETIRQSGIDYTILRPSTVYGNGDHFLNWFLKLPVIPLPGGGKTLFEPTFVKDLAEMVRLCLSSEAAKNQTFDAGGPDRTTYKQMIQTTLRVANKRKMMPTAPMFIMKLLSIIHDPFQKIYLPLALFTKDQYLMLQEDNIGDNSQLMKAFPELKLHGFEEGLRTYL